MSPRSLYALILLAVVLAAALQLTGSSQPTEPLPRTVALAPRPLVVVAQSPRARALDYLRNRPAQREPFVDHYVLLRAAVNLTSAGGGSPLFLAKNAGPATPDIGVVVQRELEGGDLATVSETEFSRGDIGFEEFTAIVDSSFAGDPREDGLELELSPEPRISWQTGCGVDHNTGEVYRQPGMPTFPQLAAESQPGSMPAGTVIYQSLLRVNAEAFRSFLRQGRWSFVPQLGELLEFTMRRLALD